MHKSDGVQLKGVNDQQSFAAIADFTALLTQALRRHGDSMRVQQLALEAFGATIDTLNANHTLHAQYTQVVVNVVMELDQAFSSHTSAAPVLSARLRVSVVIATLCQWFSPGPFYAIPST